MQQHPWWSREEWASQFTNKISDSPSLKYIIGPTAAEKDVLVKRGGRTSDRVCKPTTDEAGQRGIWLMIDMKKCGRYHLLWQGNIGGNCVSRVRGSSINSRHSALYHMSSKLDTPKNNIGWASIMHWQMTKRIWRSMSMLRSRRIWFRYRHMRCISWFRVITVS